MKCTLDKNILTHYLANQINNVFPDTIEVKDSVIKILPNVLERMSYCFSHIHKKYYFENEKPIFNHLNSDHYAMFLYWVANEAYKQDCINLAEKAFLLNKALHGVDAFYSIALPDIFLFVHPIGTILGNAKYSDYFVVYQNVTIGTDVKGAYPSFGEALVLYSKSSVIGHCSIGDNVCMAANSLVRNTNIPSNSIGVGLYPDFKIKQNSRNNKTDFFLKV